MIIKGNLCVSDQNSTGVSITAIAKIMSHCDHRVSYFIFVPVSALVLYYRIVETKVFCKLSVQDRLEEAFVYCFLKYLKCYKGYSLCMIAY